MAMAMTGWQQPIKIVAHAIQSTDRLATAQNDPRTHSGFAFALFPAHAIHSPFVALHAVSKSSPLNGVHWPWREAKRASHSACLGLSLLHCLLLLALLFLIFLSFLSLKGGFVRSYASMRCRLLRRRRPRIGFSSCDEAQFGTSNLIHSVALEILSRIISVRLLKLVIAICYGHTSLLTRKAG